jgi:hypothetical protein
VLTSHDCLSCLDIQTAFRLPLLSVSNASCVVGKPWPEKKCCCPARFFFADSSCGTDVLIEIFAIDTRICRANRLVTKETTLRRAPLYFQ